MAGPGNGPTRRRRRNELPIVARIAASLGVSDTLDGRRARRSEKPAESVRSAALIARRLGAQPLIDQAEQALAIAGST